MTTSSKKGKIDKPASRETSSRRKRKIMPPAKPSRIPRKVIIKAIEEVMSRRSSS